MYKIRPGKIVEASIIGAVLTLGATVLGGWIADTAIGQCVQPDRQRRSPGRWRSTASSRRCCRCGCCSCPRDYLSSFLKIGTIALLVDRRDRRQPEAPGAGVQHASSSAAGRCCGTGQIFPFLFITIMCGAISGFHALVSSGTTPKMITTRVARAHDRLRRDADRRAGRRRRDDRGGDACRRGDYYAMNTHAGQRARSCTTRSCRSAAAAGSSTSNDVRAAARRNRCAAAPAARSRWPSAWPTSSTARAEGLVGDARQPLADALEVLVPLRDHVRGAVHPHDDRRRHAHRAVPAAGWRGSSTPQLGRTELVAGRDRQHGAGRRSAGRGSSTPTSFDTIWRMFGIANQMLAVIALAVVRPYLANEGRGPATCG